MSCHGRIRCCRGVRERLLKLELSSREGRVLQNAVVFCEASKGGPITEYILELMELCSCEAIWMKVCNCARSCDRRETKRGSCGSDFFRDTAAKSQVCQGL